MKSVTNKFLIVVVLNIYMPLCTITNKLIYSKAVDIEPKVGVISKLLLNQTSLDLQINWLPALSD